MRIQLSVKTKKRCVAKIVQLYEQGADLLRIEKYWQNWVRRAKSGILYQNKKNTLENHVDITELDVPKFFLTSILLDYYNTLGVSNFLDQSYLSRRLQSLLSFWRIEILKVPGKMYSELVYRHMLDRIDDLHSNVLVVTDMASIDPWNVVHSILSHLNKLCNTMKT